MQENERKLGIEWHNGFLFSVFAMLVITMIRFGREQGLFCTLLFFASLIAHEAGHMLLAKVSRTRVKAMGFCKWGVYLRREKSSLFSTEIAIAAAGPAVNLLIAYFLHDFSGSGPLAWLAQMNVVLFIINMAPFGGSDGKRILTTWRELRSARLIPVGASEAR